MTQTLDTTGTSRKTVKDWLTSDRFKAEIAKLLPKHISPDRFLRVAMTAFNRNPELLKCSQPSILQACLDLSALGLEADNRRAYLVPFRKNWKDEHGQYQVTLECQLIIGYQGLVELVMNTGLVSTIHADIVCDNDLFSYDLGEITRHSIDFRRDRGPAFAAYTRVVFKDGSISCCVMSRQEIEAVRARSKVRNGPWDTDWAEMAKKTTFRRLAKWLPFRSEDLRRVDDMEVADFEEPGSRPQRPTVEVDLAQFLPSTDPNRGPERALPESPVKRKPEEEEMIEQLRRQARQQYDNQQKTRAQLPDLETFPKAELYPVGTMIKVGGAFYVRNVDGSEEEWESLPERQEIEQ